MPKLSSIAIAPLLLAVLAMPAFAQEAAPATDAAPDRQGVIGYTPADFAAARPNTALDMINRLPGFSLEDGDQIRGFAGGSGNVLVDGQRPTTKSESVSNVLARISIDQVERIDLIRGGATGIDMQGRTVVANIIRKKGDTFQQVLQINSFAFFDTGHTLPGWNYQATRNVGAHQFDFQIGRGVSMDDSVGYGWRTTVDAQTGLTTLYEKSATEGDGVPHNARLNYKGPLFGGTISANGLIGNDEFKNEGHFYSDTTDEVHVRRSGNDRGEIGLNYQRPLAANLDLELIGLSKLTQGSFDATARINNQPDPPFSQLFQIQSEAGETIGRSVLRYAYSPKLSFEGGGEIAFNYRDQQVALTRDGTPIPLPSSNVRVEELRGEVFGQGTWRPSSKYALEAGVRVERSTITQTGDTDKERSFVYPKPRVVATWSPTKNEQVRLRVEREVGQLDFEDFASSIDLMSNILSAGNDDLRPEKTWAYEIALEKRFWGNGAAVLTLRHEDITDVVDLYPFRVLIDDDNDGIPDDIDNDGFPDQRLVAGPGNIGDGTNDVIELNLTVPFEKIGIKGGQLKVEASWQNGEVRDPLTGDMRRISGQRPNNLEVSYRHDLPAQKLTLGVSWYGGWSERNFYLEEEEFLDLKNFFASFVEYKPTKSFTLRAELNNLDPYKFNIQRRVFDGPRDTGSLDFIQTERRNSQLIAMVRARWQFD